MSVHYELGDLHNFLWIAIIERTERHNVLDLRIFDRFLLGKQPASESTY